MIYRKGFLTQNFGIGMTIWSILLRKQEAMVGNGKNNQQITLQIEGL